MNEEKVRLIIERFWNDVAGLPWQDPTWINNKSLRESSRQHFVTETVFDILKLEGEKDAS